MSYLKSLCKISNRHSIQVQRRQKCARMSKVKSDISPYCFVEGINSYWRATFTRNKNFGNSKYKRTKVRKTLWGWGTIYWKNALKYIFILYKKVISSKWFRKFFFHRWILIFTMCLVLSTISKNMEKWLNGKANQEYKI